MENQQHGDLKLKDLPARIIGIPLVALLMNIVFSASEGLDFWRTEGLLLTFTHTLIYWEGIRQIWMRLQHRMPHYSQTGRRLWLLVIQVVAFGMLATLLITYAAHFLAGTSCRPQHIISGFVLGLAPTILVTLAYESVYFFHSWKQKVIETESLARMQLVSQMELLQSRMDPHFLFNSLNVLSSLIDENEAAQHYLSRLADVYRYVLMSREKELVPLREEMEVVENYLYLARVRFREGLEVKIRLSEEQLSMKVAPLAIQLLVENALKHNAITRSKPLCLEISASEGRLRVRNNLRPLAQIESSTGLGLDNIRSRYRLLGFGEVEVRQNKDFFEVELPLVPG
jgi:hypothetical protein